jgi:hypothetical protein
LSRRRKSLSRDGGLLCRNTLGRAVYAPQARIDRHQPNPVPRTESYPAFYDSYILLASTTLPFAAFPFGSSFCIRFVAAAFSFGISFGIRLVTTTFSFATLAFGVTLAFFLGAATFSFTALTLGRFRYHVTA